MKKLLVLYPKLFNCKKKFERKLLKITSSIDGFEVIFPHDSNNLIKHYFESINSQISLTCYSNWESHHITHAIIFDDGEEFVNDIRQIESNNIPFRVINIKITKVINIKKGGAFKGKKSTKDYEYIGRGSYWGNPHSMYENGDDRDEVIRKFKYDFDYEKFPNKKKSEVYKLAGKRLGCFCKPLDCHGDILADYLNSWDDGK